MADIFPEKREWSELLRYSAQETPQQRLGDAAAKWLASEFEKRGHAITPAQVQNAFMPRDALEVLLARVYKYIGPVLDLTGRIVSHSVDGGRSLARWISEKQPVFASHFISAAQASGMPTETVQVVLDTSVQLDLWAAPLFSAVRADTNGRFKVKFREVELEWKPTPALTLPPTYQNVWYVDEWGTIRYAGALAYDVDIVSRGYIEEIEDAAQEFVQGSLLAVQSARKNVLLPQALGKVVPPDTTPGASLVERQFRTLWAGYHAIRRDAQKWRQNPTVHFIANQELWGLAWVSIQNYIRSGGVPNAVVVNQSDLASFMQLEPIWTADAAIAASGPILAANFGNYSCMVYDRRLLNQGIDAWRQTNAVVGWQRHGHVSYGFCRRLMLPTN